MKTPITPEDLPAAPENASRGMAKPQSGPRATPGSERLAEWIATADRLLLAVLWMAPAWVLLLHFDKVPLVPDPEPSWVAVMTQASAERWQFGRDIVFTYGPLSPMMLSTHAGKIYTFFFIAELLFNACYIG